MQITKARLKSEILLAALMAAMLAPGALYARGGTGGGGTAIPVTADVFPQLAYPGYPYRESFGFGKDWFTPMRASGKVMRDVFASRPLQGYWIEYSSGVTRSWIAGASGQAWRFAGCGQFNPNEPSSPIQPPAPGGTLSNACVQSEVINVGLFAHPTALIPFTPFTTAFSVSADAQPSRIAASAGAYTAVGLTSANSLNANLAGNASVWLVLYPGLVAADGSIGPLRYELRLTGTAGKVLASGETVDVGWNSLAVHYDPAAKAVCATVNGAALGSFVLTATQATAIQGAKYAAFEGEGLIDNFAITQP